MLRQLGSVQSSPANKSASGQIPGQQQIPANLRCFLCNGLFEEPLLLSCGHSFCRRCVEPWLRQSTNCPHCRFTTLAPIRNTALAEKIADYKQHSGGNKPAGNNFLRSFVRRTMRPSKEARVLQREAVRASQRRPKNVVLPERHPNSPNVRQMAASLEGKIRLSQAGRGGGGQAERGKEAFPRMGGLRRSFARIRHKMAGKSIPEEEPNVESRPNSVSAVSNQPNATMGELLARNRPNWQQHFPQSNGIGTSQPAAFSEINLQSPGNFSQYSNNGSRLPSMGVSGRALRRVPSSPEEKENPKVKRSSQGNEGTGMGCALM